METKKKRGLSKYRQFLIINFILQIIVFVLPEITVNLPFSITSGNWTLELVREIKNNMPISYLFIGIIIVGILIFGWFWFGDDKNGEAATKSDINRLYQAIVTKNDKLPNIDEIGLINKEIRENVKRIKEANNEHGNNKSG